MDKQEFIQRMSTLKTESDDFIEKYILKIKDCPAIYENREQVILRYQGDDPDIVSKLFNTYCRLFYPDYKIDESNQAVINYLINIAVKKSDKRGIIIRGNVGSGKTLLALIWVSFLQNVFNEYEFCRYYTPVNIISQFMEAGYDFFTWSTGMLLLIDDIGINTENNYYGNKVNIIEQIIYSRYELFKRNPDITTICTTNLIYKDMVELYGERVMSRLNEMTNWNDGLLVGNDRRKGEIMKIWPKNNFTTGSNRLWK